MQYPDPGWNSRLLTQNLQFNGHRTPDRALFAYSRSSGQTNVISWRWERKAPVVGILANLDAMSYNALIWGIMSAGCIPFPISTRNSTAAVSHLLGKSSVQVLFTSRDTAIQGLVNSALASEDFENIVRLNTPTFEDLYVQESSGQGEYSPPPPPTSKEYDQTALILHSSGSTAYPKVVRLSHKILLQWIIALDIPGENMTGHRLALHALPMFHGMGVTAVPWAARNGMSLGVFPPQWPPVLPTPDTVIDGTTVSDCTVILTVPIFIELWSQDPVKVQQMKRLEVVMFGGGPLNKKVGNALTGMGIRLVSFYGMTESGPICSMPFPKIGSSDWEWHLMRPGCDPRYFPQEDDPNVYELVFLETPTHFLASPNMEVEGRCALASSDLVVRHPTDPQRFRIYGRKDDQIMLSTGEKTNPGPLETIITKHPLVQHAVIFGRGRAQNGVLLQPTNGHEFDPSDEFTLVEYRNAVWPNVELANEFAPSHSRIFKEMILVTHPSKPMDLTAKLVPRRHFVIDAYKEKIDAAYEAVENSAQYMLSDELEFTLPSITHLVRGMVHTVVKGNHPPDDGEDIFLHGADSLQATYIRNSIQRVLRTKDNRLAKLVSQNFVYIHPTIESLSKALLDLTYGNREDPLGYRTFRLSEMTRLVEDYSSDFPIHRAPATIAKLPGEVVLVTGTTKGLGTQLLAFLEASPDIRHVYALNRVSNDYIPLHQRQRAALTVRGLEPTIVDSAKITLVQCDFADERLGIDAKLYNELTDKITLVIHNAWKVHFNMGLEAFVPMLKGLRNLIDLALRSSLQHPPKFIFASSIGILRNWESMQRPREIRVENPEIPLGIGYTESKWIAEQILENAAERTPLHPAIVRIGQLTSNSSGAWNSTDWLPAIVRSGQVLGVLPSRADEIAWISHEIASAAIFEFRTSPHRYLHLAHPNPVPWVKIFNVFSKKLNIPLVPWNEWLSRLQQDKSNPDSNPALHLLHFYESASPIAISNREAPGIPLMDLSNALEASSTLLSQVSEEITESEVIQWINYWRRVGLLHSY